MVFTLEPGVEVCWFLPLASLAELTPFGVGIWEFVAAGGFAGGPSEDLMLRVAGGSAVLCGFFELLKRNDMAAKRLYRKRRQTCRGRRFRRAFGCGVGA